MTATAAESARVDVRSIPPRERHPRIFSTFHGLDMGQAMELVNDHDPRPLYYQFQAELPGGFSWDYLEAGPDTWRVRITRLATSASSRANGTCCGGGCGG
ncbi:MAG: DUF2249 domain-containing protein [Rhizobacter sp.]|nr:DUF2249 domain-containing protein [Rhizobacter sp.]